METRLYEASLSGSVETLEALIREDQLILDRAWVTSFNETPLHVVALRGHVSFARAILSRKPKLAAELDSLRCTPLHLASVEGHEEIVRELLLVNDDVCSARDQDGRTPLHLAVMKGRVEVIRELIRVRPESVYEKVERGGETMLHLCVKFNRLETLKMLVEYLRSNNVAVNTEEFIFNSKDNVGNNILHLAVGLKQMDTIEYLFEEIGLKEHANIKNNNGCTALDVLEYCPKRDLKTMEIRDFLLQAGVRRGRELDSDLHDHPQTCNYCSNYNKKHYSSHKTTPIARFWNKYFKADQDWLKEVRGHLITAATLTATIAYQAVLSPPGGVWEDSSYTNHGSSSYHYAGTSILGDQSSIHFVAYYLIFVVTYDAFLIFNTMSLISSVCTILLALSGIPRRNKLFLWLLVLAMCVTVFTMAFAYMSLVFMIFPILDEKIGLRMMIYKMFLILLIIFALAALLHICRFCVWLGLKCHAIKRSRRRRSSN